jgi:fructokinase
VARPLLLGVGEILWDLLPGGRQLGGAPANFAYHAHTLNAEAWPLSRVGNDALGQRILARLRELGLPRSGVSLDPDAPTGTVSVELLPGGQPSYIIHEHVAWDRLVFDETAFALACRADAVCFGSLAQRSETARSAILSLIAAASSKALRIFDVNLRQRYYSKALIQSSLEAANVLKLNDAELPVLAELFELRGDAAEQVQALAQRFRLDVVALTRGSRGSLLLQGDCWSDHPGLAVDVVDTVGAGDAFTAAMALGLLKGEDLDTINASANRLAAHVCAHAGATPPLPEGWIPPTLNRAG